MITGSTQQSTHSNKDKSQVKDNPLKRSNIFLRSKKKVEENVQNSVDSSMNNTIDFKFSTSRINRDASSSLLKLSYSSYS